MPRTKTVLKLMAPTISPTGTSSVRINNMLSLISVYSNQHPALTPYRLFYSQVVSSHWISFLRWGFGTTQVTLGLMSSLLMVLCCFALIVLGSFTVYYTSIWQSSNNVVWTQYSHHATPFRSIATTTKSRWWITVDFQVLACSMWDWMTID